MIFNGFAFALLRYPSNLFNHRIVYSFFARFASIVFFAISSVNVLQIMLPLLFSFYFSPILCIFAKYNIYYEYALPHFVNFNKIRCSPWGLLPLCPTDNFPFPARLRIRFAFPCPAAGRRAEGLRIAVAVPDGTKPAGFWAKPAGSVLCALQFISGIGVGRAGSRTAAASNRAENTSLPLTSR